MTTRDKIEFSLLMGQHTSATVRDVLALMRYASAYLATPIERRKQKMYDRMLDICVDIGAGLKPEYAAVYLVVTRNKYIEIRIPV